jgi:Transcriptional regulators
MSTEWIGRYRKIIAALVRHGNICSRTLYAYLDSNEFDIGLSVQQWQLLEYLLEHPDSTCNMAYISDQLGLLPSSFSKHVAVLVKAGFVQKYQTTKNKKNVILRITEKGNLFYKANVESHVAPMFEHFFKELEFISDSDLEAFARAINKLDGAILADDDNRSSLVRID